MQDSESIESNVHYSGAMGMVGSEPTEETLYNNVRIVI